MIVNLPSHVTEVTIQEVRLGSRATFVPIERSLYNIRCNIAIVDSFMSNM
jgi:hypothetical protein